ncbi:hypothetical protein [Nitratireductor pacificus]|uniref:Lipoprotein n=1 Tax=Nitratireductor pacificus pht-3B TaxID=391937 RepID=K2N0F6_9HYPH|nr:hypothetical protein [Nitratireductor pacificus]EKF17678.1 hypothetical protein NA2_16502 [Nitratireductor pacificus pht-3B]
MDRSITTKAAFLIVLALPAGCVNAKPDMPEQASGYSYVYGPPSNASAKSVGGGMLVPNACLAEPADGPSPAATELTIVSGLGAHLPPGCANAYNLQRMVESERDLVEGRRMGPAAAAPVARAARRYLHPDDTSIPVGGAAGSMSIDTGL